MKITIKNGQKSWQIFKKIAKFMASIHCHAVFKNTALTKPFLLRK